MPVLLFSILENLRFTSQPNLAILKTLFDVLHPFMPSPLGGLQPPSNVRVRGKSNVSGMALKQK